MMLRLLRDILVVLMGFALLALLLGAGFFLFLIFAAAATGFAVYILIRQWLDRMRGSGREEMTVIEAEYREVERDRE